MVWENTTLGPCGYSSALAIANLEGVFGALGLARAVPGDRPDRGEGPPPGDRRPATGYGIQATGRGAP
jgi:hypothetical protein